MPQAKGTINDAATAVQPGEEPVEGKLPAALVCAGVVEEISFAISDISVHPPTGHPAHAEAQTKSLGISNKQFHTVVIGNLHSIATAYLSQILEKQEIFKKYRSIGKVGPIYQSCGDSRSIR